MRLSKTTYYGDFFIYAAIILALAITVWMQQRWPLRLQWLGEFAIGMSIWTFLEYVLHRWVLHRVPYIAPMHDAHHRAPRDLLGTPTWLSVPLIWLIFFFPLWREGSFAAASGLTAGVMTGFFWYGVLHHAAHHGRPRLLATWFSNCTRRHARHHYSKRSVNFGVTTAVWDHLFGTAEGTSRAVTPSPRRFQVTSRP